MLQPVYEWENAPVADRIPELVSHSSSDEVIYVDGKQKSLFCFGRSLSRMTCEVSAPWLGKYLIGRIERSVVEVRVADADQRNCDEVARLYVQQKTGSEPRPLFKVKTLRRVTVAADARSTLRFLLGPHALALREKAMKRDVEAAMFVISAGNGSQRLQQQSWSSLDRTRDF